METITASLYGGRIKTVMNAQDLKESAEMHREIYRAIRSHNPTQARLTMEQHLNLARAAQAIEDRLAQENAATEAAAAAQSPTKDPAPSNA